METPLGNVSFRRTGDPVLEPSVEADADAAGNAGNVSFWLTVGEVPGDAEVGMLRPQMSYHVVNVWQVLQYLWFVLQQCMHMLHI